MLTIEMMHELWPHGDERIPGLIEAIAAAAPTVFPKYGLTTDVMVAQAMAQFSEECGAGLEVVEDLDYSAEGLMRTWPSRFDFAKAEAFAHQPEKIADEVYDGRMGNRPGTNDGWNFRGRGGSQVTGRDGYQNLAAKVGLDLINNPDLVNQANNFLECAVADFVLCGCLPYAAADDVLGVTYHLNGGYIGLAQREAWLVRWKAAFNREAPVLHSTVWLQMSLNKLGTEPPLQTDGAFGPLTAAAVKEFQQQHGLPPDGKADPQTLAAIDRALAAG